MVESRFPLVWTRLLDVVQMVHQDSNQHREQNRDCECFETSGYSSQMVLPAGAGRSGLTGGGKYNCHFG
jgi:hypothetical protein